MTPTQAQFTRSVSLVSIPIDWNDPGKGQRLRAEYWKRKAEYWHSKATAKRRGFQCRTGCRLVGF